MNAHDLCVMTLKGLAIDGVEAANSGHPGMPMGMADVATVLWTRFLKHDPADPAWPDRDRFVLSAGHGSMLLYSLLHLTGYPLSTDDLRHFRQWGSLTPGHPEVGHTVGVETTTGPLGQGFANGVGMAIAERILRDTFGAELCDHRIYAIVSDGDLMEGVSQEAASLAGHLGLGRLIYLYDDNHITIDGSTDLSFSEDTVERFRAYGWDVQEIDGHDPDAIASAIGLAIAEEARPSLICCRTTIGKGSRIQGSEKTHGSPLGKDEARWVKHAMGLDPEEAFAVSDEARAAFRPRIGPSERAAWRERHADHPQAADFDTWYRRDGAALVDRVAWPAFKAGDKVATRKSSEATLQAIVAAGPWVIGGSADLQGSNGTNTKKPVFSASKFVDAQTIAFGVREHGMAAISNGMALHGGVLPYCATFLVFHDYMRPSVRLASLMRQPVVFIYTHDSIFLGEDGPTHQPIEHLLAIRAIPGMRLMRPADAAEVVEAWKFALRHSHGPTALVLTRQNLPTFDRAVLGAAEGLHQGAYVLVDVPDPQVVLIATGSEVWAAVDAAKLLTGHRVRVVSMPSREQFLAQSPAYRASVLPPGVRRVSIEAGLTLGWEGVIGDSGLAIGIDQFGASAPDHVLAEKFGLTPPLLAARIAAFLGAPA